MSTLPLSFGAVFGSAQSAAPSARTASGEVPTGRYYTTRGGERIDQVAQTVYGRQSGVVEGLLLANPGLAFQPYELPADLAVLCPPMVASETAADKPREVSLWG